MTSPTATTTVRTIAGQQHRADLPMLLTWARIPLAIGVAGCVLVDQRLLGAASLTLFVLVDLLDGSAARRSAHGDDAQRRGLDSLIDRTTVVVVFLAAAIHSAWFLVPALLVGACSLAALPVALGSYRRSDIVLKAPVLHRIWSLSLFASGLLWFAGASVAATLTAIAGSALCVACTVHLIEEHLRIARSAGST
ncbi:CDP-alcohol phosphatidyltransferase family protein [Nocardia sp. NPDC050712]|uniref:CDP-alcohol phosphatidyltransferase family protein n=1 Tax=Nocardia sp. NPDC050712 TaxID=3155518 RepID=UPI0033DE6617